MSVYQTLLHEIAPDLNPAGVEASMRLEYGTLDHLSRAQFVSEAEIARQIALGDSDYLREAAESYGMTAEFEAWQERLAVAD